MPLKYRAMARDPFYFFRGTAHLFYEDLASVNALPASPLTWVCGDLHIENFGSYKGDNRLVYFDLNDFDEAALAPASWELARMTTSIFVALTTMGAANAEAKNMALLFLEKYAAVAGKGRARYIEPQTAKGITRSFLLKVSERKQKELVKERTVKKNGQLVLQADNKRLFKIDPSLVTALSAFINDWLTANLLHNRFHVIDAGFRIAGTGSIGVKRYVFLLEKVNGDRKYLLLDMKQSLPSTLQAHLTPSERQPERSVLAGLGRAGIQQPAWHSEAARVVAIQERMQNISPALLGTGIFNNESFVIKEMQPTADKINFDLLENRFNDIEEVLENMALLTASAQLRSSGRQGAAVADELIAFGRDCSFIQPIITYADQYASQVVADHNSYLAAFNSDYFEYR